LKLIIRLRSKPPYTIYSDACILGQVLGNLIDNAIKYTTKGWILVKIVNVGSNRLKLHVCDTGIGITEQQRQNIFKEFYRGHRRREDHCCSGMGIGLAYVLKAIDYLPNHSLSFFSKPNHGSDFRLKLPVAIEATDGKSRYDHSSSNLTGCFVYLVEDNQQVLNAMAEQLTAWGCLVQKANSKAETQAALIENYRLPDLLITDFYLEDNETAHDIIASIEADFGPVPTLILSAHTISAEDKARFRETTLLLRKPASAAVLMEMMAKAMGK
jgi:CheY-like chemotaxis protein